MTGNVEALKPPRPLSPLAAGEFRRMKARMRAIGTLSDVDDAALYQYANQFADVEASVRDQAETLRLVKRLLRTVKRLDGGTLVAALREISQLKKLAARQGTQIRQGRNVLRAFLVELGMTPAARGRVDPVPAERATAAARLQAQRERESEEEFFADGLR